MTPIIGQVDTDGGPEEPPYNLGQPGIGGSKFVGAYAGSSFYLRKAAESEYNEHMAIGSVLLQVPSLQHMGLLNRLAFVPMGIYPAQPGEWS